MKNILRRLKRRLISAPRKSLTPEEAEIHRLLALPERSSCTSGLLGNPMHVNDAHALVWMYKQIFQGAVCEFKTESEAPLILDCGANIGVTVRYWKHLYPKARIIAFEADPEIYKLLVENCGSMADVELHNKAVWIDEDKLEFSANRSVGGRLSHLSEKGDCTDTYVVEAVRLRDFLDRSIQFLKIDIEGAEHEVMEDCADSLGKVEKMFIEYHSFADQPQNLGRFFGNIERSGFRIHLHTELAAKQPFIERPVLNGKDLRLDIFAVR